ncbi:MAG: FAD-dependent oxidoreductase [Planctomycetota bacterium]
MTTPGPHYFRPDWIARTDETLHADLCVYGGTAAGVVAAVKATRLGLDTVLLQPGRHLGGMTTGGLSLTDFGNKTAVGGLAGSFYRRLGQRDGLEACWNFWPSDARAVIDEMVDEAGFVVRRAAYLDRVDMDGQHLTALRCLGGLTVRARMFIDASYEGDLLAAAGVDHIIGREPNARYDETLNGVQVPDDHQFRPAVVSPFVTENDPSSGLLPGIEATNWRHHTGRGDHKVQAYCFRLCTTEDPELKLDWDAPDGYDPADYELPRRWCTQPVAMEMDSDPLRVWKTGEPTTQPRKFDTLKKRTPGGFKKVDTNNFGAVGSDFIGANHAWPTADYALREALFQAHVRYQRGLLHFFAHDPALDDKWHTAYRRWGLARDEFADTGNWPHQLYVRESRRLIGDAVITEHDCHGRTRVADPVGIGAYAMDSHHCCRFVAEVDGKPVVMNEGDVQVPPTDPYPIGYRTLIPKRGRAENLLVPVCFSASHIAYGSARMEPVFMVLGETVACAAALAVRGNNAVQDVPYDELRSLLDEAGQVVDTADIDAAGATETGN